MKKSGVYIFVLTIIIASIIFVSSVNLDLNHDGSINVKDLQLLASHYGGKTPYNSTFDVNNDSKVDIYDVVGVARVVNTSSSNNAKLLVSEGFENSNLAPDGWFDDTTVSIANESRPGSLGTHALQWHWTKGSIAPQGASRIDFTPSDSIYISYWVKFSSNWVGSGQLYHPHMFHVLTTADSHYIGPSITHLTLYDELLYLNGDIVSNLAIQDALMIDQSNINVDLFGVTENHSVGGANGKHEFNNNMSNVSWDVYRYNSSFYTNYKMFRPRNYTISDSGKNSWHHIESYWKLNSIVNGKAQQDGVLQYWVDGVLKINRTNVYYRTGANPNMKFRTFLMAPYIGDGSPVNQTMWIDDISLYDKRP